ncbi:MAG: hypothetical protein HY832_01140 [Candidatus Aenigmarchaeota archaeon]|nr:hypothetical protein [Candidatus Aenigmarchaeota archaeon]
MENREITDLFLQHDQLLTPSALDYLADKDVSRFLDKSTKLVLDVVDLQEIEAHVRFRVIKNFTSKPKEITTTDFILYYTSKFEKMKKVITERINEEFVSLNRIGTVYDSMTVIGIVREIRKEQEKAVVTIEDLTASVPILFDEALIKDLEIDDVVAVHAQNSGSVLVGQKLFYPDVPLRDSTKGTGKACFISDLKLDEAPADYFETFLRWFSREEIPWLFVCGTIGDKDVFEGLVKKYCSNRKVVVSAASIIDYPSVPLDFDAPFLISLSNPALVEVNGIKILLMQKLQTAMLKKRYLGRSKLILKDDYLALDELPDVIHFGDGPAQVTNYKSITLVNSGSLLDEFRPVVVDFATRETELVKLPVN